MKIIKRIIFCLAITCVFLHTNKCHANVVIRSAKQAIEWIENTLSTDFCFGPAKNIFFSHEEQNEKINSIKYAFDQISSSHVTEKVTEEIDNLTSSATGISDIVRKKLSTIGYWFWGTSSEESYLDNIRKNGITSEEQFEYAFEKTNKMLKALNAIQNNLPFTGWFSKENLSEEQIQRIKALQEKVEKSKADYTSIYRKLNYIEKPKYYIKAILDAYCSSPCIKWTLLCLLSGATVGTLTSLYHSENLKEGIKWKDIKKGAKWACYTTGLAGAAVIAGWLIKNI